MFLPSKNVYKGAFVWDTVIILNNKIVIVMHLYSLIEVLCMFKYECVLIIISIFLMNWYVTSKQKQLF